MTGLCVVALSAFVKEKKNEKENKCVMLDIISA
jgi:hypothetical protein